MRRIRMAMVLFAIGGWIAVGALAQQEQHHPEQATPQTGSQPGQMGSQMGSTMSGGMAMCQQMMSGGMACPHQEMKSLVAKVVTNFGAVEKEQNPALLKTKLAELGTLLKQLQAKSEEKCPMMEQMQGPMSGEHQMGAGPESK